MRQKTNQINEGNSSDRTNETQRKNQIRLGEF